MKPMGYGKAAALLVTLVELPIFGGLLSALAFPRYALFCFGGGFGAMLLALFLSMFYSTMRSRGLMRIGLTVQYSDGSDAYYDIIYDKMPVDISQLDGNGKHVYLIKDVEGAEWIIQMDHPLEEVLPRFDSIPLFMGMPTPVLTRFLTGVSVSDNVLKDEAKPSWFHRVLRKKPEKDVPSREVYAYATPVTVKRLKASNPSFDGVRSLFKEVVSYDYVELLKENEQLRDHNEDLKRKLDEHLPITIRTKPLRVEDAPKVKLDWRLVAALLLVVAVTLAALKYLGVV
ncbi:MAG: hypothetical protein QFX35_03370 [Candidatus Verstraetearchaeota archaeon]|nr:hypothetical protein [Candidatus Verstraetearchaeota archaeon]